MKNMQMKVSAHTSIILDDAKQHEKVLRQFKAEHFKIEQQQGKKSVSLEY